MTRDFNERCKNEPDKVIKEILDMHKRQAKRIHDYSKKLEVCELQIEMMTKVISKSGENAEQMLEKETLKLEKKLKKIEVSDE